MKISDVCKITGLTRRTVRFYEEKGLITPKSESRNGKSFREYDDDDIKRLTAVADLRKLEFSIEEISGMIDAPDSIGGLVRERRIALSEEIGVKKEILSVLEGLEADIPKDIFALSRRAGQSLGKVPVKDIEPDFSQFETLTADERQQSIERFNESQRKAGRRRKALKIILLGLLTALILFLLAVGLSFIPKSIEISADGSYDGELDPAGETVTVKGSLFTPLFFESYFVGDITFAQKTEYNTHCEAYIYPAFIDKYGEGFFYNLNENKTIGRLYDFHEDSMELYISGVDAKNDSITIKIGIENEKNITDAWLYTQSLDSEGFLYIKEEFVFRALSYDSAYRDDNA